MATHAPLELERFLPYRLSILSNRVSQAIAREYQQRFDLSMTEWRVMAVIARYDGDGLSASAVAGHTEMDKVAVSRALARLVAAKRVTRRAHDGDKRRSVLRLSAAGWKVHDTVAPLARAHEQAMLAELTAEDRRALARILDKLAPV
jgi:DNA-binding MarR family transcriptional regulator